MGINVAILNYILKAGLAYRWNTMPIVWPEITAESEPQISACSLDAAGALGLVLQYLLSAIHYTSLEQIFAILPSTVSHYIEVTLL
jgi:hypothetical protein